MCIYMHSFRNVKSKRWYRQSGHLPCDCHADSQLNSIHQVTDQPRKFDDTCWLNTTRAGLVQLPQAAKMSRKMTWCSIFITKLMMMHSAGWRSQRQKHSQYNVIQYNKIIVRLLSRIWSVGSRRAGRAGYMLRMVKEWNCRSECTASV